MSLVEYVSADGHVVEPADLWTTRMDKRFRDRAPRGESVRFECLAMGAGMLPI